MSRAHDLTLQDAALTPSHGPAFAIPLSSPTIRNDIIKALLPYLETDTLLCWAPSPPKDADPATTVSPTLRELQVRTAEPIISYLTSNIWPGVHLNPTLDDGSILPSRQPAETRSVVQGWMAGLSAWELVALERAVFAGKSLCVGARLVCEWGESFADVRQALNIGKDAGSKRFGIEEAAEACSLEVRWQTGRWGEVEDTHDVENEDLRSQFGRAILVASGTGRA